MLYPKFVYAIVLILVIKETIAFTDLRDPIKDKIKTLLSTWASDDQLKSLIQWITDEAWSGKKPTEISGGLIPWGMKNGNGQQVLDLIGIYQNLTDGLNGTEQANHLLGKMFGVLAAKTDPVYEAVISKWSSMKSSGKSKAECYDQAWAMANNSLDKTAMQDLIDSVKAAFTQKECDVGYETVNEKFMFLDQYKFTESPCSGTE